MAMQRLGPFSNSDIKEIQFILDEHGFSYEVIYPSRDELAEIRLRKRQSHSLTRQTFSGNLEFIYIEVNVEQNEFLPEELEKFGVPLGSANFDPEFYKKEYLCPRCGHLGRLEITCPKHKLKLVSFEEYIVQKNRRQRRLFTLFLVLAMAASIFFSRLGRH